MGKPRQFQVTSNGSDVTAVIGTAASHYSDEQTPETARQVDGTLAD